MVDRMKSEGSVKGAIWFDENNAQQFEFFPHDSLEKIISQALQTFNVPGELSEWALVSEQSNRYITEDNRQDELKPGVVAMIKSSPSKLAEASINILSCKTDNDIANELVNICKYAEEFQYVQEFEKRDGINYLIELIKRTPAFYDMHCSTLGYALQALYLVLEIMGTDYWDRILDNMIIKKMVDIVKSDQSKKKVLGAEQFSRTSTMSTNTLTRNSSIRESDYNSSNNKNVTGDKEPLMGQYALSVLDSVVRFTETGNEIICNLLDVTDITIYITDQNMECSQYALALLNAMFSKADNKLKFNEKLMECNTRVRIEKLLPSVSSEYNMDLSHHISEYQHYIMALHKEPSETPVSLENAVHKSMLEKIKIDALTDDGEWSYLGFSNEEDLTADFQNCPPGFLALQCINHFILKYRDKHREMILEQLSKDKDRRCPFVRAAAAVTNILYQQLRIGRDYIGVEIDFLPILFSKDNVFYELFCISILLFNTTWHEMHAKTSDFSKVVDVVNEQLQFVLKGEKKINNLEEFKTSLNNIPFSKIQEQRLKSLEKDSLPIIELREKLKPGLQDMVNKQRLTVLEAGELFAVPRTNKSRKSLYCKLSSNHKFLHYGFNIDSNTAPSIEELPEKLSISDLENIVLWKDLKKTSRRGLDSPLGFSIEYNQSQMAGEVKTIDFIARTEDVFSYWTDGIKVLKDEDASNKSAKEHLSMLLEMELKIRQLDILDIEGLSLPEYKPSIPSLPDNFNFHYSFN